MKSSSIIVIIFSLIISIGCTHYPKGVKQALNLAGTNKKELEKVITFYRDDPADSLKLKAAYFLIENMVDQYSYEGDLLDHYYEYFKCPKKRTLDSISNIYGSFNLSKLNMKFDIQQLNSQFLIKNIESAFTVWQEQPWSKDISFEDFCEYILPYRVSNEKIDYERAEIYEHYHGLLDSVLMEDGTIMDACYAVNKSLKENGWNGTYDITFLPHFSFKTLEKYKIGTCRDRVDYTIHIMRALGIPIANDFTPQWANRSMGHNWNVLLDEKGKMHEFIGTDFSPGEKNYQAVGTKPPKVYRYTFSRQRESLAMKKKDKDQVPSFFRSAHFKDVTDSFHSCSDIQISLKGELASQSKFAYVCVFDNKSWIPVHWGKISDWKVMFTKIVNDSIVYLPVFYENNKLNPANDPFLLTKDGKIKYLKADTSKRQTIIIDRKYPIFLDRMYLTRMYEGKFQASDNPSFKNPVNVYTIKEASYEMRWHEVPAALPGQFRYYRYLAPDNSYGNIAELDFYYKGIKLKGQVIGTSGSWLNKPEKYFTSAMDGDKLTFFEYNQPDGAWVGIDFGKPINIDQIRYLPRNDGNMIIPGHKYELCYWDQNQWISAGIQIATDTKLVYNHVPAGALFILHNHTEGKEERIFTYERGKQVWW